MIVGSRPLPHFISIHFTIYSSPFINSRFAASYFAYLSTMSSSKQSKKSISKTAKPKAARPHPFKVTAELRSLKPKDTHKRTSVAFPGYYSQTDQFGRFCFQITEAVYQALMDDAKGLGFEKTDENTSCANPDSYTGNWKVVGKAAKKCDLPKGGLNPGYAQISGNLCFGLVGDKGEEKEALYLQVVNVKEIEDDEEVTAEE